MNITKEITPIQYAKRAGFHKSYVHRLLKNEEIEKLPNIIKVKKFSRFYILEVPIDFLEPPLTLINEPPA